MTGFDYCPACRRVLDTAAALDAHNESASRGERSYTCAVNVAVRTVETHRRPQGSSSHARGKQ